MGKDTTIGHWEIAGVVSPKPLPTFPEGFPDALIREFEEKTGHKVLCNKPYSGTQVLKDYGEQAMNRECPHRVHQCRQCVPGGRQRGAGAGARSSTVTARSPVRC